MTTQHQLEREYNFTPYELQYLQTTQRLAMERLEGIEKLIDRKLTEDESQVHHDLYEFGLTVRDAIKEDKTTLPIKMGVIYWLMGIWHPLYDETARQPVFIEHDVMFTRSKIERMRSMLHKDYNTYANGK